MTHRHRGKWPSDAFTGPARPPASRCAAGPAARENALPPLPATQGAQSACCRGPWHEPATVYARFPGQSLTHRSSPARGQSRIKCTIASALCSSSSFSVLLQQLVPRPPTPNTGPKRLGGGFDPPAPCPDSSDRGTETPAELRVRAFPAASHFGVDPFRLLISGLSCFQGELGADRNGGCIFFCPFTGPGVSQPRPTSRIQPGACSSCIGAEPGLRRVARACVLSCHMAEPSGRDRNPKPGQAEIRALTLGICTEKACDRPRALPCPPAGAPRGVLAAEGQPFALARPQRTEKASVCNTGSNCKKRF